MRHTSTGAYTRTLGEMRVCKFSKKKSDARSGHRSFVHWWLPNRHSRESVEATGKPDCEYHRLETPADEQNSMPPWHAARGHGATNEEIDRDACDDRDSRADTPPLFVRNVAAVVRNPVVFAHGILLSCENIYLLLQVNEYVKGKPAHPLTARNRRGFGRLVKPPASETATLAGVFR